MMKEVRYVHRARRLAPHHAHQSRMRVSERIHRDAAEEIQILSPVLIVEVATLPADEDQRRAPIGIHHVAVGVPNGQSRSIASLGTGFLAQCPTPATAGEAVVTRVPGPL